MMELVNQAYPNARAVPLAEFYNNPKEKGLWFKGSEDLEVIPTEYGWGEPMYDYYNYSWDYGINPKFLKFIEDHGWECEPYDAGTVHAYYKGGR